MISIQGVYGKVFVLDLVNDNEDTYTIRSNDSIEIEEGICTIEELRYILNGIETKRINVSNIDKQIIIDLIDIKGDSGGSGGIDPSILNNKEDKSNKTDIIDSSNNSSIIKYPSIKGMIDYIDNNISTGSQGPKGDKGDKGDIGPKGDKGDIGVQWKGLHVNHGSYLVRDAVKFNGSAYIALGNTSTNPDEIGSTQNLFYKSSRGSPYACDIVCQQYLTDRAIVIEQVNPYFYAGGFTGTYEIIIAFELGETPSSTVATVSSGPLNAPSSAGTVLWSLLTPLEVAAGTSFYVMVRPISHPNACRTVGHSTIALNLDTGIVKRTGIVVRCANASNDTWVTNANTSSFDFSIVGKFSDWLLIVEKGDSGSGGADDLDAYTKSETNSLLATKANTSDLSAVATSGSYDDLDNKPTIPTIPTIPTDVSAFANDAGYLTQHQDISGKVDKEAGKGLSTNDYSNADKTKVSLITASGIGDKYLSDDGNYKTVSGGGVSESDVKGWIARNIAVGNAYGVGIMPPSATHSGSISIGVGTISYGNDSIQIGKSANSKSNSVAIGSNAKSNEHYAVAIGSAATASNYYAISIGMDSQAQHSSVALGYRAINSNNTHFNCVLLGSNTVVTSANQVQLGNSTTTTYAYGAVQDRSDIRDKTDIQDCTLGLDFINALRPVKYKWDYREDYARDLFPHIDKELYFLEQDYQAALSKLPQVDRNDFYDDEAYQSALEQQQNDRCAFFQNPVKDGSKTRNREHHGLIAQEFKQVLDNLGVDHAAYQDHSASGGMDVKSIGYAELIPNLIKAIQELTLRIEAIEND